MPRVQVNPGLNGLNIKHQTNGKHYINIFRIKMNQGFKCIQRLIRFGYCRTIPVNVHLYQMFNFWRFRTTDMMRTEPTVHFLNFFLAVYPRAKVKKRFFPIVNNPSYGIMPCQVMFPFQKGQFMLQRIADRRDAPRTIFIPFTASYRKKTPHTAV